jgi:N-succinyl-L-ornithine transcarbamylase
VITFYCFRHPSNHKPLKHFIAAQDATHLNALVEKALQYKKTPFVNKALGANKKVGLLFLNPSLRTRLSTYVAARNLGMEVVVFNADKEGWALEFEEGAIMSGHTVEHVKDAAPILGRYFDILCIRTFPALNNKEDDYSELVINSFVQYAGVPIVSLESATLHPLQSLTDVITIHETFNQKTKPKIVLTWAPHVKPLPQCVANSFVQWMNAWHKAKMQDGEEGINFVITHPEAYELAGQFTHGNTIIYDQDEALRNADYVYVKNWSTYTDYGKIYENDPRWMLTNKKMEITNHAKIMHCLPVRRNVELSDEVLDGPHSLVTQQAANRVWAAQAVLASILENNF